MAQKRTIDIDINTNADQAAKEFDTLATGVKKAADSAENLDAKFEDVFKGVEPLTTRLGEAEDRMYELALAGDTTSKEYNALLKKVSEYRKVQIATDMVVDGAAQTMSQKLGSALSGVTSGFAVTQGAMGLFGSENEKLEKSLLKVQSALAIQQGVEGLKQSYRDLAIGTKIATLRQTAFTFVTSASTKGLKLFRVAMISTGVGALVVGLGLLVANFDKVKRVLSNVTDGFKKGSIATKALMITFAPLILTIKLVQKGLQAIGLLESDATKQRKKDAEFRKQEAADELVRHEARMTQIRKEQAAREALFAKEIELAKARGEETAAMEKKALEDKLKDLTDNFATEQKAFDKEYGESVKRTNQEILDAKKKNAELKALRDADSKDLSEEQRERREMLGGSLNDLIEENNRAVQSGLKQLEFFNGAARKKFGDTTANQIEVASKNIEIFNANADKSEKDSRKQRIADHKTFLKNRLDAERKIEDLKILAIKDDQKRELAQNKVHFERLIEDLKTNENLKASERAELQKLYDAQALTQQGVINQKYVDLEKKKNEDIDAVKQKSNEDRIAKEDALFLLQLEAENDREGIEIANLQKSFEAKYALAVDNAELMNDLMELQETEEAKIRDKFRDEKTAKDKAASDKEKAEAKEVADYKEMVVSKSLSAISEVAALFSDGSEKQARRAFNVQKAVGIAQATIDTSLAIMKVAKETTDVTPVQGFRIANMVAMGVAGAAQIAAIASAKFQGGGGGDVPTPTGGGGGGGEAQAPSFNVVGDSGINQIAQLQQSPVQAFVVSGEVTTSQALDRNRVENATL